MCVRYLPGATYDGWPVRIEGALTQECVKELNGGTVPPEKEGDANMFGVPPVWKMRGVFLTSIFNVLSKAGWKLVSRFCCTFFFLLYISLLYFIIVIFKLAMGVGRGLSQRLHLQNCMYCPGQCIRNMNQSKLKPKS